MDDTCRRFRVIFEAHSHADVVQLTAEQRTLFEEHDCEDCEAWMDAEDERSLEKLFATAPALRGAFEEMKTVVGPVLRACFAARRMYNEYKKREQDEPC